METETIIVVLLVALIVLVAGVFVFNRRAPDVVLSAGDTLDALERQIETINRERKEDREEREREKKDARAEREKMQAEIQILRVQLDSCLEVKKEMKEVFDAMRQGGQGQLQQPPQTNVNIGMEQNAASPKTTPQYFPAPNAPKQ